MTILADADNWQTLRVDMSLQSDGSLSVAEHASDLIPEDMTLIKRRYWSDSNEHVAVLRVIRIDPDGKETAQAFEMTSWGQLQVKVPHGGEGPQNLEYRIESKVTGVVLPVWGIPRALRQMDWPAVVPPLDRLKEIVSLWREAGSNPGSRYLLDYQFFFPDDQNNLDIPSTLSVAREWKAVHPISSDRVAHVVKSPTFGFPDSLRVNALFDYAGSVTPAAVDMRAHRVRVFSIAAFPVIALLIWLAYFGRRVLTRPKIAEIDERWLREHLFNEPPEVVAAKLGGWSAGVSIESFLRRLERDGKIALDIQTIDAGTDDEDQVVSIRLRVPREQFSEYERLVIDALILKGNAVDSREIQERHSGKDFDPMESAEKWLRDLRDKTRSAQKSPRLSRLFSFALFAAGMWLIVLDLTRNSVEEPVPLFATLMFLSPLVAVWPTRRISLVWIPLLLMSAFLAVVHSITPQPLGIYTSLGVLLALVGAFHAIVAEASVRRKPADLVAAAAWLRSPQAHIRADWHPHLVALGIQEAKGNEESDEDWGWTLSTFAESARRQ